MCILRTIVYNEHIAALVMPINEWACIVVIEIQFQIPIEAVMTKESISIVKRNIQYKYIKYHRLYRDQIWISKKDGYHTTLKRSLEEETLGKMDIREAMNN